MSTMPGRCRICHGSLREFLDLGLQPSANAFVRPQDADREALHRLVIGSCETCTMVQLMEDVPQEERYHAGYRYAASGSASHRRHFESVARHFLDRELRAPGAFIVEIGSNDGVMLETIAAAGIRHLGVEPSAGVAQVAAAKGISVREDFFNAGTAADISARHGRADVIFGANTICHISYLDSIMRGIDALLTLDGIFVFEEPYLDTIINKMAFDQIYDEHVFYFTVRSIRALAARFGFELVNAEHIPLHGGEIRYTIARPGTRPVADAVADLLAREEAAGFADPSVLDRFGTAVARVRADLTALLSDLRADGKTVVGYGAPAKATTITNYCRIGPELLPFTCDSTPEKQGHLIPGSHIPVREPAAFAADYPDFAVLFAWNHAEEIMAKEHHFREQGGRWILYVPDVRVI